MRCAGSMASFDELAASSAFFGGPISRPAARALSESSNTQSGRRWPLVGGHEVVRKLSLSRSIRRQQGKLGGDDRQVVCRRRSASRLRRRLRRGRLRLNLHARCLFLRRRSWFPVWQAASAALNHRGVLGLANRHTFPSPGRRPPPEGGARSQGPCWARRRSTTGRGIQHRDRTQHSAILRNNQP